MVGDGGASTIPLSVATPRVFLKDLISNRHHNLLMKGDSMNRYSINITAQVHFFWLKMFCTRKLLL